MSINQNRLNLVLQYTLLTAGEEDTAFDRQLGPIHLIKYVYLADLLYAKRNNGEIYTGVEWQFYKFGPWSQVVNQSIDPALNAIRANQHTFQSDYGSEDWSRWDLQDANLLDSKTREIPSSITIHLGSLIHRYTKHTPELLDFVYKTKPMLHAAPNEILDFGLMAEPEEERESTEAIQLSRKKQKKLSAQMSELKQKFANRNRVRRKLINPFPDQTNDKVLKEGTAWLDSLAGEEFEKKKISVKFDPEVWKSDTRKSDELP